MVSESIFALPPKGPKTGGVTAKVCMNELGLERKRKQEHEGGGKI